MCNSIELDLIAYAAPLYQVLALPGIIAIADADAIGDDDDDRRRPRVFAPGRWASVICWPSWSAAVVDYETCIAASATTWTASV